MGPPVLSGEGQTGKRARAHSPVLFARREAHFVWPAQWRFAGSFIECALGRVSFLVILLHLTAPAWPQGHPNVGSRHPPCCVLFQSPDQKAEDHGEDRPARRGPGGAPPAGGPEPGPRRFGRSSPKVAVNAVSPGKGNMTVLVLITGVRTQRDREPGVLRGGASRGDRLIPRLEAAPSLEFPTCLLETRLTGPW